MRAIPIGVCDPATKLKLPFVSYLINCGVTGFPSPADDYAQERLDLNKRLIKHPAATFLVLATGDSMTGAGIFDGDILIVDRALDANHNRIIIACIEGELTVKRYYEDKRLKRTFLVADNPEHPPFEITPETDFSVWGVVTCNIHLHEPL